VGLSPAHGTSAVTSPGSRWGAWRDLCLGLRMQQGNKEVNDKGPRHSQSYVEIRGLARPSRRYVAPAAVESLKIGVQPDYEQARKRRGVS
jgi:hypothetical protein